VVVARRLLNKKTLYVFVMYFGREGHAEHETVTDAFCSLLGQDIWDEGRRQRSFVVDIWTKGST
jgi:hypothetical protein